MYDFVLSAAFGTLQIFLLITALYFIKNGKRHFAILTAILKFVMYCVAISTVYRKYYPHIFRCFAGYIAGMPIGALVILLIYLFIKLRKMKN